MVVSNPPYISLDDFSDLPFNVKNEPYAALYGGKNGMKFIKRIIDGSCRYLKKSGILMMEMGYDQSSAVRKLLENSNTYRDIEIYKDYSRIDRIVKARINSEENRA